MKQHPFTHSSGPPVPSFLPRIRPQARGFRQFIGHYRWELAVLVCLLSAVPVSHAGQGYGYVTTGTQAKAHTIDPGSQGRMRVAWIDASGAKDVVMVGGFEKGFSREHSRRQIFQAKKKLWGLKLESVGDDRHILCVSDGLTSSFATRFIKFDGEFQEIGQMNWTTGSNFLSFGRMLDDNGKLFLGSYKTTARGRHVQASSLSAAPWMVIQLEREEEEDTSYYSNSEVVLLPARPVTGLDTAIAPDGTVTAVYEFGGIRLKRFGPDKRLQTKLKLVERPLSRLSKNGRTAVAVLDDDTTLLAWEWHEFSFSGTKLVPRSATPGFRVLRSNGGSAPVVHLHPSSTVPEMNDRPAVGLRLEGTGAVAWTVRTATGSTVWLQRLDDELRAYESPRIVDARPGYDTDHPIIRRDGEGGLFLSWRCTSKVQGIASEIGVLDLDELDRKPVDLGIIRNGSKMQIHWSSPPAARVTLWHSPRLAASDAVAICRETGISGQRMVEHQPESAKGFYWLSVE